MKLLLGGIISIKSYPIMDGIFIFGKEVRIWKRKK